MIGNGPCRHDRRARDRWRSWPSRSYWKADKIALPVSRAEPADPEQYERLHNIVEGLCIAGGLPKPGVYVVDDPAPNAFATGRNPKHAAIAVTTGLLEKMNRVELEGVVAHELSHIRNYDILVSTLAVTMVGCDRPDDATSRSARCGGTVAGSVVAAIRSDRGNPLAIVGFVLLILAPIIAKAMQATISRQPRDAGRRERLPDDALPAGTDLGAGKTAGRHDGDAFAASTATAHLWIEQPMSGVGDGGSSAVPTDCSTPTHRSTSASHC